MSDPDEIADVLAAAIKYDIDVARASCIKALFDPSIIEHNSLAVYAITVQFDLTDEMGIAARKTLEHPSPICRRVAAPILKVLDSIPASSLYKLLRYRECCQRLTAELILHFEPNNHTCFYSCNHCVEYNNQPGKFTIVEALYEKYALEAVKDSPCGAVIRKSHLLNLTEVLAPGDKPSCLECLDEALTMLNDIKNVLAAMIDIEISAVKFDSF